MEDEDLETALAAVPNQNLHHRHVELGGCRGTEAAWQPTRVCYNYNPACCGSAIAHLESAAKHEVIGQLGEFYATG